MASHSTVGLPSQARHAAKPPALSAAVRSVFGAKPSVGLQTMDGLPLLPSHVAAWETPADPPVETSEDTELFGERSTRDGIRKGLVQFYESTGQLKADGAVTEMTLRMDTELELLRRQCFAERNARWNHHTPDMFTYAVPVKETWAPVPYMGERKKRQLLHKWRTGEEKNDEELSEYCGAWLSVNDEAVRERPWPPKEFAFKPNSKPGRGSGSGNGNRLNGKKKVVGMASVVEERPKYARMCCVCQTQSSALWRKRPRPTLTPALTVVAIANGTTPNVDPTAVLPTPIVPAPTATPPEEDDICLICYLKTERKDIFEKKKAEKAKKAREDAARAAAEARQLKKQQQQLKKKFKKLVAQQEQLKQEAFGSETVASSASSHVPDILRLDTSTFKFNTDSSSGVAYSDAPEEKKRREKKSKKEKKKKKKKKKKKDWDSSDSEEGEANTSLRIILPSPPQRQMDGYVYADRPPSATMRDEEPTLVKQEHEDVDDSRAAKRPKRTSTPSASSSRKRKSSDAIIEPIILHLPPAVSPPPTPSRPRAKQSTDTKKRARPVKKEGARERELRALGQYCPVCNMTYEDNDPSPFVCCDSCEMWVHAACDTSLTPAALAALSESNDKYICPLCGGR
ncbi:hypothetical protein Poli38472_005425 [Pythium oligandrum]|uniref:PHD-type domain-containing protein n=1 Tax=Pythium oligandrum TaxID=41045 RepID=A0A8K1FKG7_PYTOL|nr:hypothetical protein Poli38472_005425 [Pythium oligandrum]|eukprot:TMW62807.1 hypothetical protein Poli38472_005425 [Pythium oligandrum]